MKTLTVEIPESVEFSEFDLKMIVAGQLYQQDKLSSGPARIGKREFIETIGKHGVSVFSESISDLCRDIEHA